MQCQAVFTTLEVAQYELLWLVRSPAGKLQPFSRDKLFMSLYQSCQHRPTVLTDAAGLAETVIAKLRLQAEAGILDSRSISQTAQVALNRFDKAASVHYAAFHK